MKKAPHLIPYGKQWVDAADIRAVVRVLKSDRLTQGPNVEKFEEAFARAVSAPYAVAVSSGTAGLHLAALAAGFDRGDEVLTTPLTFVASSNSILYTGATPAFVDIEDRTLGLDPLKAERSVGPKTRGILSVHFAGQPCVLGDKRKFSKKNNFTVIEDASHALGAEVKSSGGWTPVGACAQSDMAVFSFHPVKHITTGEGGMITTRRKELYEKLRLLRTHGIEKDASKFELKDGPHRPWHYEMKLLGFNYRITDIQCALGLSQLKKLGRFVKIRREIAAFYDKSFRNIDFLRIPEVMPDRRSSYHLYPLRIDFKRLDRSRADVMRTLERRGILTQVHYTPVTHQPYYRKRFRTKTADFPVCEKYFSQALSIPLFPAMTVSDTKNIVRGIQSFFD